MRGSRWTTDLFPWNVLRIDGKRQSHRIKGTILRFFNSAKSFLIHQRNVFSLVVVDKIRNSWRLSIFLVPTWKFSRNCPILKPSNSKIHYEIIVKVFTRFRITYRYLNPILTWTISPLLQRLHSRTADSIPNIWIPRWNIVDLCRWLHAMETILTGRLHLEFPHPVILSKFERNDQHMLNGAVLMIFVISHCFFSNHPFIKKIFLWYA